MYEDFSLNRNTEIDYLNGEIVNLAKKHHVPTPINEKIVELVKQAEQDQRGSPRIKSKQLLQLVTS